MQNAEKRTLVAHDKLLVDVIKRQAGSLKKAILEGTMNSVEAGSTEIDINFMAEKSEDIKNPSPAFLSIYDDGIGIKTKDELIKHFETFGQPHEENENVIWKQFRMGRGQMFAFGKNTWRTSTFEMFVDVDKMELDYFLRENLDYASGCKIDIELYKNPLDNYTIYSIKSLKEEVKEQVRFVKIPVKFNDEIVSIDPSTLNWDYEDKYAYYKFTDNSSLKIYNLGVYVMSQNIKEAGVGGIVVSKQMLKVNFARNDVDSTCPIYEQINKIVKINKIKKINKSYKTMTDDTRINLLIDLRDAKQNPYELKGKRIFQLSNNKWISWKMFEKDGRPWCFAPNGDMVADKSMQSNKAICFDDSIPFELGYDGPLDMFFEWLWSDSMMQKYYVSNDNEIFIKSLKNKFILFDKNEFVSKNCNMTTLKETFEESYTVIPYSKLKKTEKRIIDVLNNLRCWDNRRIGIGVSDVANAWTDGSSYIMIDKKYMGDISVNTIGSVLNLFTMLCHEMAHNISSAGTHYHGPEFYEEYYNITRQKYWKNPLNYAYSFSEQMGRARIEELKRKEEQKEQELKDKLGLVKE